MNLGVFTRSVLLAIGSLFLCTASIAQAKNVAIETGVSERLAAERKAVLSDLHYALHFTLPEEKTKAVAGEETITLQWKQNSNPLLLDFNAPDSAVRAVVVNDKRIRVKREKEHLLIDAKFLTNGENTITIFFTAGNLSLNRNNDFVYTLLVPDRARTVFPCFDQPNLKARFQLTLTLPAQWKALTNAPLLDSTRKGISKTYHYQESDLFSTYLFSFVAGQFEEMAQQRDGRELRFLYRETDTTKIRLSMDTIFGWHQKAINFLEEYTKIPFPFQKLDFAAIPDFQYGGMEHVGAIDYKAAVLFLDSGATKDQENARSNLIAHETAHMWFGDLVTMQWFNDVWMKEVFANFMADKITQGTQAGNNYELKFLLTHFPRAYTIDRTAGANPIRQSLANLQEAGTLYGPIIYDKAPVMMRQLERLMGADAFRDGLREYLKQYSYGNATWSDLIRILDRLTPADLQAWNKVWVNTPGRPLIDYRMQTRNGKIAQFTVTQKGERSAGYLLPQLFEIALVYKDTVHQVTVNMNKAAVTVTQLAGEPVPEMVLFNSSGQGYGVFPVDRNWQAVSNLKDPLMRAAAYINLYENMLNGKGIDAPRLLQAYLAFLATEPEELSSSLLTGYVTDIYWRFLPSEKRSAFAKEIEKQFWNMMQNDTLPNRKKILFRGYQTVALSKNALDTLYRVWQQQAPPPGVKLTEEDYISLALNLTLKEYPDTTILTEQQRRITNPDRKQRLQFLRPALSSDVHTRDSFFALLRDPFIRKKEAWVQEALTYLHHPLRAASSIRYLKQSLDLLQEVQVTGDIFFPAAWLSATFGSYQRSEAAVIVREFLRAHPNYPPKLRDKILQAADPLFRASQLLQPADSKTE